MPCRPATAITSIALQRKSLHVSKPASATGVYFWPYDIFGYFLPGVVLLAPLTQFQSDIRQHLVLRFQPSNWVDISMLAIITYVVGHLVAAISSWWLERILLKYTFGYPVAQFFCPYNSGPPLRRFVCWLTELHKRSPVTWLKGRHGLNWLFVVTRRVCLQMRALLDLLPGFVHPYDSKYRQALEAKFRHLAGVGYQNWAIKRRTHDIFWTVQSYVTENMPQTYRSALHFVELYGFSRNASFAFLVLAFYPLCPNWQSTLEGGQPIPNWLWSSVCGMAAFVLYVNFVKLLRRQNDLILRAFVANYRVDE